MRSAASAAVHFAVVATIWDAVAIGLENPASFRGTADGLRFGAATLAIHAAVALAGCAALAPIVRRSPRTAAAVSFGVGLAVWLFVWGSSRVHVRWLFGEPLASPKSLLASAVVLVASVAVAVVIARTLQRPLAAAAARSWPLVALSAATAVAVAWAVWPAEVAPRRTGGAAPGRDLLLVTLDTTRADHLSSFGYPRGTTPALDRLARGADWMGTLVAPVPLTNPSHVSIFTGLGPREHGVRNNGTALADTTSTFVARLHEGGFRAAAFVSGTPMKRSLSGLGAGFETYDDAFSFLERMHPMLTAIAVVRAAARVLPLDLLERRANATVAAAERWLVSTQGRRFVWVHLFDAHSPYTAPATLTSRFAIESRGWSHRGRSVVEWPIAHYDAELRSTDRAVGALLRSFHEATGGDGAVVLVADHGEGLSDHDALTHGTQLFDEDVRVPVVASWGAGRAGLHPEFLASSAALHDVILAIAGGDEPRFAEADEVVSETFPPEGRFRRTALLRRDSSGDVRKLVVDWDEGSEQRYSLGADPGEMKPAPDDPAWQRLRAELTPPGASEGTEELDAETVRKLRALGYVH